MLMTEELTERQYYTFTRKIKKIKLRQIAEVLGCSVPLLSMWETGRTDINDYYVKNYKQFIDNK
ncbi:Helix-turn-helix protein [Desulfosporosinus acidiphilus SJ4]|uniref:Helix-turn-helix protein n=1 Tax=Desulfosporosinus acidiphilus (strain DSM 22704 / JCM 16185 / SJ4) TaxID=646529 RepID=I4D5C1_DESAJ|nr:Helix-turn-helix protein [Desulfosporosinus acidiphilus SJ4]